MNLDLGYGRVFSSPAILRNVKLETSKEKVNRNWKKSGFNEYVFWLLYEEIVRSSHKDNGTYKEARNEMTNATYNFEIIKYNNINCLSNFGNEGKDSEERKGERKITSK